MLSPISKMMSATILGLALLVLPTLTNSSSVTAYAGDSRRYDDDDHNKYDKKYSKKKKKGDDDDDDRRWRGRNRRFDRGDRWRRNNWRNDWWWGSRRGFRR